MWLIVTLKEISKGFGIVCLFFIISGLYYLVKPTPEDKVIEQQMKMYPFGFHSADQNGDTVVLQVDQKSQIGMSTDKKIYKYSMKNGLYREGEKKPFGCEMTVSCNGTERNLIVYIDKDNKGLEGVRYEPSDNKDLFYEAIGKYTKKKNYPPIRIRLDDNGREL